MAVINYQSDEVLTRSSH